LCAPPRDAYEGAVDAIGAVLGAVDAIGAADAMDAEPPAAA
jgi:hypothetical protein